jgi:hypothetical protein
MDLGEFVQPLLFSTIQFDEALDNFDIADPHRRQDEFDDINTAPVVNAPLYDTSITNPIKKSNTSLASFPDYSDEVMSDFRLAQMLGKPMEIPSVVDLDTADNYVDFIKNTIKNVIASENEFNISNTEITDKSKTE